MHLRYNYMTACIDCNDNRHAQTVMKELGIAYSHSTPQSMGDQFWFWNCDSVPDPLPEYLTVLDVDPMDCVGYGLSKEEAIEIASQPLKDK